jgi:hypothetical protein
MKIFFISESLEKATSPCLAKDCYTSPLFVAGRSFCERNGKKWFILSGEHAVLEPESFVSPPVACLSRLPARQKRAWPGHVLRCLVGLGLASEEFVFLAGDGHTLPLLLMFDHFWPFRGLEEKEQVAWFSSDGRS